MLDGGKILQENIEERNKNWLLKRFVFGLWYDEIEQVEIPYSTRRNSKIPDEKKFQTMKWRRTIYRDLEIKLGYKIDEVTKVAKWNIIVIGSIQKYYCGGRNDGQFSALQAIAAINELARDLRLDKNKAKFTKLEIGLNLFDLPFSVQNYINLFVLRYKSYPFVEMKDKSGSSLIGKVALLSHRQIKLYHKVENTMRYEIHYSNMQDLREKYAISFLSSLTVDVLDQMAEDLLISTFEDIVSLNGIKILDGYFPFGTSKKEQEIMKDFSNQVTLNFLEGEIADAQKLGNQRKVESLRKYWKRKRDSFKMLVIKHGNRSDEMILSYLRGALRSAPDKCPIVKSGINSKNRTFIKENNKGNKEVKAESMHHENIFQTDN